MNDFQVIVPDDDPSFIIMRSFAAPQSLIWECYTTPEHMKHFWGPHGSTNPVMEIDLKVGGVWRVVMRFENGQEYGYSSVYMDIVAPEKLVYRDAPYDWAGGLQGLPPIHLHSTISIHEIEERTTVTVKVRAPDLEDRDTQLRNGFADTVKFGFERMAIYLEELTAATKTGA